MLLYVSLKVSETYYCRCFHEWALLAPFVYMFFLPVLHTSVWMKGSVRMEDFLRLNSLRFCLRVTFHPFIAGLELNMTITFSPHSEDNTCHLWVSMAANEQ